MSPLFFLTYGLKLISLDNVLIFLTWQACTCSMWRRLCLYLLFVLRHTAAFVTVKFEQVPFVSHLFNDEVNKVFTLSIRLSVTSLCELAVISVSAEFYFSTGGAGGGGGGAGNISWMNEFLLDLSPFSAPSIPPLFPPSNCHLSLTASLSLHFSLHLPPSQWEFLCTCLNRESRTAVGQRTERRKEGRGKEKKGKQEKESRRNKSTYRVCTNRKEVRQFGSKRRVREEFCQGFKFAVARSPAGLFCFFWRPVAIFVRQCRSGLGWMPSCCKRNWWNVCCAHEWEPPDRR